VSGRVAVVGAGVVGTNLATASVRAGREVVLAVRDPAGEQAAAAASSASLNAVSLPEAAGEAEMIVYAAVAEVVRNLGDLDGAVLVDATNVVGGALPDGARSVLDVIARANPDAALVKAFNTIGAEAFLSPTIDGMPLFMPIAGDQPGADLVCRLAIEIGFDAMVIGDRDAAPVVEHAAELWIHLALRAGLGRGFGFARLQR